MPIYQLILLHLSLSQRTIQAVLKLIVADIDKIQAEQKPKYKICLNILIMLNIIKFTLFWFKNILSS
jgi:hypothetical protein